MWQCSGGPAPATRQPQLYGTGQKLWAATGIHHAVTSETIWDDGPSNPHYEGAVRGPSPL